MKTTSLLLLCATALLAPAATTKDTDGTSAPAFTSAEQIMKATRDGLCIAVMPSADTPLPLSNAPWRVMQVLLAGETNAAELAAAFRAAGTSGSITCRPLASDRLPYPNDFANAVVVGPGGSPGAAKTLVSEAWRVLAPEGVLLLDHPGGSNVDTLARSEGIAAPVVTMKDGMFAIRKPYPPEMDEWPQLEHDAARTRISHDKVVGIPTGFQWLHGEEGPYRNAQAMLAAGGRVFYAISESSTSFIIEARDAYNGVLAWSRRFTCRPAQARGRFMRPPPAKPAGFAADGERVYVTPEAGGAAVALSAATGSTIMTYATGGTLVLHDGLLVTHDPSSTQWNVIDPATGKQLRSLGTTNADPGSVMLCAGNNAYFLENMSAGVTAAPPARTSGTAAPEPAVKNIVCADFHTGEVKWRAPAFNNGSLYWANRGLVALLRLNEDVTFFSADDGRYLWDTVSTTKKGNHAAAFYLGDRVWTYGPERWYYSFDPTNGGPPRADLGRNKDFGRCGPHLATDRFIIGTDFSIYYLTNDFDVKKDMFNAPCVYDCFFTRQDCQIGGLAANGFYYQYGNVCACLPYVHGVAGLTSVPSPDDKTLAARSGPDFVMARMDASTASNLKSEIPNPQSAPWPTYRHDAFRSAVTMAGITPAVTQQWCMPAGPHVSAPVIANGKVFVAIPDSHAVLALDASSGARLWSCYAGGRVDTPPTYHNGTVLFGAHDGWVYCADARDGALKWKRRIAPGDDQICVRGQLESPWPVVGAVLVDNSVAYASAGRHGDADGGVRFCALDPANGDVLWRLRIEGFPPYRTDPHRNYIEARDPFPIPYDEEAMKIAEPDLVAGMVRAFRNDLLISDDNTVYIGAMAVDKAQRAPVGAPVGEALYSGGPGLLYESTGESAWLNKPVRWLLAGKTSGPEWRSFRAKGISANLLAVSREHAYGVLMDSRKIYLFRKERPKGPAGEEPLRNSVWSVPLSTNDIPAALVVAGDTVTVAVRNPDNASGKLLFFSTETGKQAGSCPLPGAPRFDGVAVAGGRIYASLGDGRVTCLGTR